MPRPNKPRAVFAESNVAKRVALERKRANLTYEQLAQRMKALGCPIQVSALHKIEKGNPPRRITVDEMVAFAQAFGLTLNEIAADPASLVRSEARDLQEHATIALSASLDAKRASDEYFDEYVGAMDALVQLTAGHPDLAQELRELAGSDEQQQAALRIVDLEVQETRRAAFEEVKRRFSTD